MWLRLLDVLKEDKLSKDSRFIDNASRMGHLVELIEILSTKFILKTTAEWMTLLDLAGVPSGPVLNVLQMQQNPQVIHRQMVMDVDHLIAGQIKAIGCPIKFSGTSPASNRGAPVLGQHTSEVLSEYGYSAFDIQELVKTGIALQG